MELERGECITEIESKVCKEMSLLRNVSPIRRIDLNKSGKMWIVNFVDRRFFFYLILKVHYFDFKFDRFFFSNIMGMFFIF